MRKTSTTITLLLPLALASLAAFGVYVYTNQPKPEPVSPPPVTAPPPSPPPAKTMSRGIEAGMRAITVAVDGVSGGSRDLKPGDRVDLFAVAPLSDHPEGRVSHQILSNTEVLGVSLDGEKRGRKAKRWTATLAVTPKEAAAVTSADPAAKLRIVLRPEKEDDAGRQPATAFTPSGDRIGFVPQKRDLFALIPPGMRAVTLRVSSTDGVAGLFRPGDRVDVVVSCPYGNVQTDRMAEGDEGERIGTHLETHRNAKVYFQNVPVVATEKSMAWGTDLEGPTGWVSLAVTPVDAIKLTVLAAANTKKKTIRLIGRRLDDRRRVDTPGADLIELITGTKSYNHAEMIRGTRRTETTFLRHLDTGKPDSTIRAPSPDRPPYVAESAAPSGRPHTPLGKDRHTGDDNPLHLARTAGQSPDTHLLLPFDQ